MYSFYSFIIIFILFLTIFICRLVLLTNTSWLCIWNLCHAIENVKSRAPSKESTEEYEYNRKRRVRGRNRKFNDVQRKKWKRFFFFVPFHFIHMLNTSENRLNCHETCHIFCRHSKGFSIHFNQQNRLRFSYSFFQIIRFFWVFFLC